ncbi:PqqD family protein [Raineyella fluvialis]|uniref:PqqD family peptide modification chaperone n=1 Tax=Raineyella fluvialis TaxID=2662261 RepID=A0A5Q2FAQ2_9ACTN|nr:PqqD family protein [Raineyella fluvialis]QGF23879.1 PqqD family peptide modification chaperone [Raineyella fluvialis]
MNVGSDAKENPSCEQLGYRLADGVGAVEVDGIFYVAPVPQGPIRILAGSAAVIWRELITDGSAGTLADRVAGSVGVDVAEVRASVRMFIDELLRDGLLTRR